MSLASTISVAWTGASGALYGVRLVGCLLSAKQRVLLMISPAARIVLDVEHGIKLPASTEAIQAYLCDYFQCTFEQLQVIDQYQWFSAVASGSSAPKQMVICPCSTNTLAAVAMGTSQQIVDRAAAVVLKEQGQLILVLRETPLHAIHLENMLKLARLGVTIMPAAPGFYHQPKCIEDLIDFMVARIMDHLNLPQDLMLPWQD
jgi:flavin prenyltransferase